MDIDQIHEETEMSIAEEGIRIEEIHFRIINRNRGDNSII